MPILEVQTIVKQQKSHLDLESASTLKPTG